MAKTKRKSKDKKLKQEIDCFLAVHTFLLAITAKVEKILAKKIEQQERAKK